jgi:nicotinate-nucleotide adenylyltransferase
MIGLLGGTFDPVHHGHLRVALDARELLGLDQVRLVPLRGPCTATSRAPPAGCGAT